MFTLGLMAPWMIVGSCTEVVSTVKIDEALGAV
jgi:hypothetical protein